MADKTGIEWTEATWNPIRGCTKVSAGCDNCYAMRQARRMDHPGGAYEGLTRILSGRPQWNGKIRLVPELLDQPLRWTRPRLIFVNSMSDLFHPGVPREFIDRVFAAMAMAPQHTFQILTKRPERMAEYMVKRVANRIELAVMSTQGWSPDAIDRVRGMPLPNVWLGTSVEDQATANERIPLLLDTPAAVRWLSCEPLLGAVDLGYGSDGCDHPRRTCEDIGCWRAIDWVVAGGESGPGARPMHPEWVRSLRDQCETAGVPFFFKQWGDWFPCVADDHADGNGLVVAPSIEHDGDIERRSGESTHAVQWVEKQQMWRVGKRIAGRKLDGRTWDQMPEGRS